MRLAHLLSILALASLFGACSAKTSQPIVHRPAIGVLGPYSGSVTSGGFVFVSGKIGTPGGRFTQEVQTVLDAVERELARSGAALSDVISVTVFLTNLDQYGEFNEIYAQRFDRPYPARACVEVSRLPGGARVELQVIAQAGIRVVPLSD